MITGVVALYGLANGLLLNATPQISLALNLSSRELGLIGAGIPMGYALSCLICGQIFARIPGKYVLLCGLSVAAVSLIVMSTARGAGLCVAAQIGFGLGSGAFWPFASAWLLDFQAEGIAKTRLLRHYNVAWTSATAAGMFAGGVLCQHLYIREAIYAAIACVGLAFALAFAPKATPPGHIDEGGSEAGGQALPRLGFGILLAAILVNLAALGTRTVILTNYAELNSVAGFGADRMGLIAGTSLVAQLGAFTVGALYERWLGMRRIYIAMGLGLLCVNLIFAFSTELPLLLGAVMIHGFVLALAFQSGLLAAMHFFSSPRTGTTFHEAVVGAAGLSPLLGGVLVTQLK